MRVKNINKLSFPKGLVTETNTAGDLVIPIIKKSLKYLNVGYKDECCNETFCPVEAPCSSGADIYLERTYSQANTERLANQLIPGVLYKITDRGIYIEAVDTDKFSLNGVREQYVPAQYTIGIDGNGNNWKGVFNFTLNSTSVATGLYIWGGKVWRKTNGLTLILISDDFNLTGPHVQLIDPNSFTNGEYVLKAFGVEYDFINDWVQLQWDNRGNKIGCAKVVWDEILGENIAYNPSTSTDWNLPILRNNKAAGIYNNKVDTVIDFNNAKLLIKNNVSSSISNNNIESGITNNATQFAISENNVKNITLNTCVEILQNNNKGQIAGNNVSSIIGNENNGDIVNINSASNNIFYCKYNGSIDGSIAGIDGNINGREPKVVVADYTLEPWDWSLVYVPEGNMSVFLPNYMSTAHTSMHTNLSSYDITFDPLVGATLDNADTHTKLGDTVGSIASITMTNTVGGHVLGGRTKA